MGKNLYLILFNFYALLSQVIGVAGETNLHSRRKRLIDKTRYGSRPVTVKQVPYVVQILRDGGHVCGGSILSTNNILTAAHCVYPTNGTYSVLSGSHIRNRGVPHEIIMKIEHPGFEFGLKGNDLAILVISPPIDVESSPNKRIKLYEGTLPPDDDVIFNGWGCNRIILGKQFYPRQLLSITLPIINQRDCQRHYPKPLDIIYATDICAFDKRGEKGLCRGDSGGPLVFNNEQIGVSSWGSLTPDQKYPDVFINVAHPVYRNWIKSNMIHVF